jgi:Bardet-Biedl syndrome 9 protein
VVVSSKFDQLVNLRSTALEAQIVASYVSSSGEPRLTSQTLPLPLYLACRPKPAQKSALYKFTLDTEFGAQPLPDLFDDMLYAYQDLGLDVQETLGPSAVQAMGFQFWASGSADAASSGVNDGEARSGAATATAPAIVSILVSKTAGRYRVQSDCLPALITIINELGRRLNQRISELKTAMSEEPKDRRAGTLAVGPPLVSYADALPLDEYYASITTHFSIRQKIIENLSQLNDSAHQFRMIEKRLLVRFKDRNPTPLGGLDILMKETYKKLLFLGDSVQTLQNRLITAANDLSCLSRLVVSLISLKFGFSPAETKLLENHFCVDFIDTPEQVRACVDIIRITIILE